MPERYVLDLPWPVSLNRMYEVKRVRGHAQIGLTAEAIKFKDDVQWFAYKAGVRRPIEGRIGFHVTVHPQLPKDAEARMRTLGDRWEDGVRCLDLDNCLKLLVDALKGKAFGDDRMLWDLHVKRGVPKVKPGLHVELWHIPYDIPQMDLI